MKNINAAEAWVKFDFPELDPEEKYEISNKGTIRSFKTSRIGGKIINGSFLSGYNIIIVKMLNGKKKTFFVHKLVAHYFLDKPTKDRTFVIHLDYDRGNNDASNLKWVNKQEMYAHRKKDPEYDVKKIKNSKLTVDDVIEIRKRLELAQDKKGGVFAKIAKDFGITLTQLKRIQNGENWSHVK